MSAVSAERRQQAPNKATFKAAVATTAHILTPKAKNTTTGTTVKVNYNTGSKI